MTSASVSKRLYRSCSLNTTLTSRCCIIWEMMKLTKLSIHCKKGLHRCWAIMEVKRLTQLLLMMKLICLDLWRNNNHKNKGWRIHLLYRWCMCKIRRHRSHFGRLVGTITFKLFSRLILIWIRAVRISSKCINCWWKKSLLYVKLYSSLYHIQCVKNWEKE